jgi:hypothetical protein
MGQDPWRTSPWRHQPGMARPEWNAHLPGRYPIGKQAEFNHRLLYRLPSCAPPESDPFYSYRAPVTTGSGGSTPLFCRGSCQLPNFHSRVWRDTPRRVPNISALTEQRPPLTRDGVPPRRSLEPSVPLGVATIGPADCHPFAMAPGPAHPS